MQYVITCTTRTGSTLLCDLLAQTGRHGTPHEYFEPLLFDQLTGALDTIGSFDQEMADPAAYLARLHRRLAAPDGTFGIKLQAFQLPRYRPVLDAPGGPRPADLRFVRLVRQDRLAQAISGVKALQTGGWHSGIVPAARPVFDRAAIARQIEKIAEWEAQWDAFYAKLGLKPLTLAYEELVADLPGALALVGEHLGVPISREEAARLQPRLARQSDAVNADWRAAYLAPAMAGPPSAG